MDRAAVDEAVVTANQKRKCPARGAIRQSQEAVLHSEATAAAVRTNLSVQADLRAAVHGSLS